MLKLLWIIIPKAKFHQKVIITKLIVVDENGSSGCTLDLLWKLSESIYDIK